MIKSIIPKSEILKKYIDVFYLFDKERPEDLSYIAFPHINTSISLFENALINRANNDVTIIANAPKDNHFCIELLGKYVEPVFVTYKGKVKEIAIVFKPLGINHFIKKEMADVANNFSQAFNNQEWLGFMPTLFESVDEILQIELLEEFLLKKLNVVNCDNMYKAIDYLSDSENDYSINQIASLLEMNLKTFQRQFYKHLVCSPSNYKRIARFRNSLNFGVLNEEIRKLTEVAYMTNYYDQSYFVREYKKLTKLNPKAFFNTISILDKKNIVWKIK